MKKYVTAILVLNLMAGLLFLGLRESRGQMPAEEAAQAAAGSVRGRELEEGRGTQEEDVRKIAITFDDGPHPHYTEQLLDGLKERGVVATFFVTGEHAELHPDIIRRMQEDGHLIGNHTYSHIQLTRSNREVFKEELIKTNEILEEITGGE